MRLYKYRSYESNVKNRTLEIITKQELFFAGIESFNDPFDGKVHLRYDGKINEIRAAQVRVQYTMNLKKDEKFEGITMSDAISLTKNKITQKYIDDETHSIERLGRIQTLHNTKGVLSLSSKNDNLLMWSHYSYNHRGVCFGFDWENEEGIFSTAKKVRYQTHYDDIWSWLHTDDEIISRIFYAKAIGWQYEDEYRIVKNSIGVEKFELGSLKEIIFGCMMTTENISEIIKICKVNNLDVEFKIAILDVKSYMINICDYLEDEL